MNNKEVKLHLGCGYNHLDGFINVDIDKEHSPDVVQDLNKKWKFKNNSVDYIRCHFVLEHVDWQHFFKESSRVLKKGGVLDLRVPNCLDFTSWQDPTHVRGWFVNSYLHICNDEMTHYNTNEKPWNFKFLKKTLLFRKNPLNKLLFMFWLFLRMDNEAYRFVWAVEWLMEKE